MEAENLFFTIFVVWYFKTYHSSHYLVLPVINFFKTMNDCVKYYNHLIAPELFSYDDDDISSDDDDVIDNPVEPTPIVKYEDKYLQEVWKMDRQFNFDGNDEFNLKIAELLNANIESNQKRNKEIKLLLIQVDLKIQIYDDVVDDYVVYDNNEDRLSFGQPLADKIKTLTDEKICLLEESKLLDSYLDTIDGQEHCMKQAKEAALKIFTEQKLKGLCNCSVLENTPLGNVLMIYDNERETFKYYSDNSIPYRYLEVVARKYVKQFNCRAIFVDMEEELQLAEKKKEQKKEQEKKKMEEDERKKKENMSTLAPVQEKKAVFAKFKSYNKDAASGHVNTGAPPKNSLPNKPKTDKSEADYVLKNNSNRYIYEGKLINYSFLKKVDKKTADKKSAMTFADFKKMKL